MCHLPSCRYSSVKLVSALFALDMWELGKPQARLELVLVADDCGMVFPCIDLLSID